MRNPPRSNAGQTSRVQTRKFHVPHDPGVSRAIWLACRQQAAVRNLATAELLERPARPLRGAARRNVIGLQTLASRARASHKWLEAVLTTVARPGLALAKTSMDAREEGDRVQAEHLVEALRKAKQERTRAQSENATDAKADIKAKRPLESLPRNVQRRRIEPRSLFQSRKRTDRQRRNRLTLHEGTRVVDAHTIHVPGVGPVRTRERVPDGFHLVSLTIVERSSEHAALRGRKLRPEERTWRIHAQERVPAPLKPLPAEPTSTGVDHGVVHALTTCDHAGAIVFHKHDTKRTGTRARRIAKLAERAKRCRRNSRQHRKLRREAGRLRRRNENIRREETRSWANRIAHGHDVVGIEELRHANMRASAKGTTEEPGADAWMEQLPRKVQHRRIEPRRMFRSRKHTDRTCSNQLTVYEDVRRVDDHTFRIPGVGHVRTRERIPADFEVVSLTVVERSAECASLRGRNLRPEERTWRIHAQQRVPAPLKALPPEPVSIGVDPGVATAITTADSNGKVTFRNHDTGRTERRKRRYEKLMAHLARCQEGSRQGKKLRRKAKRVRRKIRATEHEETRAWSREIAVTKDIVGIEDAQHENMRANAQGTHERPGKRVAQKRGLNRALAASRPGLTAAEIRQACVREGTRYFLVPARNTSRRCAACGHTDRENRESQASFRCVSCGHEAHADANAAENIRQEACRLHRAVVERSGTKLPGVPPGSRPRPGAIARAGDEPKGQSDKNDEAAPTEAAQA